jgi:hypothetical protein
MSRKMLVSTSLLLAIGLFAVPLSRAAGPESEDYKNLLQWISAPADVKSLAPGRTYTEKDEAALKAFVPQPVWNLYFYPGMAMEVSSTGDYPIKPEFVAATNANKGKVTVDPDGEIRGYDGFGFPFDPLQLSDKDPQVALKVLWNYWYRPGQDDYYMPMELRLRGVGGKDDRILQFVATDNLYVGHKSNPDGLLVPSEKEVESKMWMEFLSPKDVWGTQMIITKFRDHHRDDNVVAYTRKERRSRRVSADERIDPFMGTNLLIEDFYGFSGQVPEWKWEYLGRRNVLATMNVRSNVDWGGPNGWVPHGARWEVRDCYVLAGTPTNGKDPYGKRILFIDSQRFWTTWMLGYDRSGKFWKVNQHALAWSDGYKVAKGAEGNPASKYCRYENNANGHKMLHVGENMIDVKKQEATIVHCYTCCYEMDGKEAADHYSDKNLGAH